METTYDCWFKIVLIGDPNVGKTSIVRQYIDGNFRTRSTSTHGVDFSRKSLRIGSSAVKLQIWDTAGHERFRTITQSYYRNADATVLVYDIGAEKSFRSLPEWLLEVEKYAGSNVTRMLIGNKSDRIDREITQEQGWKFAQENDMPFLETSAKNSNNIDKLFLQLAKTLLESHIDKTPSNSGGEPSLTVTLKTVSKQASEDRRRCCN